MASIQDLCIIDLDLLISWGTKLDVSGALQASHRQWWLTPRLKDFVLDKWAALDNVASQWFLLGLLLSILCGTDSDFYIN